MKIVYISSANFWGGATVALFGIVSYMKNFGHEVIVFTVSNEGRLVEELNKIGVKWFAPRNKYSLNVWPNSRNPLIFVFKLFMHAWNNRCAKRKLKSLIIKFKPDIVHTNVGPLNLAIDICKKYNIPHVWHLREYQDKDFGIHYIPSNKFFKKAIRQDNNFCISITKDIFNYWELRDNIDKVIYDGVFSEDILSRSRKKTKEKYILFTGRIEPAKAPYDLIEAFKKYLDKYGDKGYMLKIVGDYNVDVMYKKKCDNFIALNNLHDKVEFCGHRNDVYDLMASARCMVVCSHNEGFGFITVEAMLNRCLVIGRYAGGTKEQLDLGLECEGFPIALSYTNLDELSDKLNEALSYDWTSMIECAYHMVSTHYTQEIHCKSVEEYYKNILSNEISNVKNNSRR